MLSSRFFKDINCAENEALMCPHLPLFFFYIDSGILFFNQDLYRIFIHVN